jgi:hypothetical protein
MWDNRVTMHRGRRYDMDQVRDLHRRRDGDDLLRTQRQGQVEAVDFEGKVGTGAADRVDRWGHLPGMRDLLDAEHNALGIGKIAKPRAVGPFEEFRCARAVLADNTVDGAVGVEHDQWQAVTHQIPAQNAGKADKLVDAAAINEIGISGNRELTAHREHERVPPFLAMADEAEAAIAGVPCQ